MADSIVRVPDARDNPPPAVVLEHYPLSESRHPPVSWRSFWYGFGSAFGLIGLAAILVLLLRLANG
ncbi:MAG: hypothetical protein CMN30_25610 [Sandaracinus sp.]|nr:hypothetical protein [Sandaracinus sp.]